MPDDVFSVEKPVAKNVEALLRGMLADFLEAEQDLDRIGKEEQAAADKRDNLRQEIIKVMADHALVSQKFEDGMMVIRAVRQHPSVPKGCRPQFHKWLQKNGYWSLARISAQQESALLRERLENEQEIPAYIKVFKEDTLQVRGRKKGD